MVLKNHTPHRGRKHIFTMQLLVSRQCLQTGSLSTRKMCSPCGCGACWGLYCLVQCFRLLSRPFRYVFMYVCLFSMCLLLSLGLLLLSLMFSIAQSIVSVCFLKGVCLLLSLGLLVLSLLFLLSRLFRYVLYGCVSIAQPEASISLSNRHTPIRNIFVYGNTKIVLLTRAGSMVLKSHAPHRGREYIFTMQKVIETERGREREGRTISVVRLLPRSLPSPSH